MQKKKEYFVEEKGAQKVMNGYESYPHKYWYDYHKFTSKACALSA
jgi:hypothetical protein